jgi:hypothetical protein
MVLLACLYTGGVIFGLSGSSPGLILSRSCLARKAAVPVFSTGTHQALASTAYPYLSGLLQRPPWEAKVLSVFVLHFSAIDSIIIWTKCWPLYSVETWWRVSAREPCSVMHAIAAWFQIERLRVCPRVCPSVEIDMGYDMAFGMSGIC